MPNPLLALLDRQVLRRRVEAESAEALQRLKEALGKEPTGTTANSDETEEP
jgi:hypothetical protein